VKILALDIGTGTQDILLYDSEKPLENCCKFVLPSPAKIQARRLRSLDCDVHLTGCVVGGGPLSRAARALGERGHRVTVHPDAAATVKNDPRKVRARGFEITESCPPGSRIVVLDELRLGEHLEYLHRIGEEPPQGFAFALQDHGRAGVEELDREYRFARFSERLEQTHSLLSLVFTPEELPDYYLRLQSARRYVEHFCPGIPAILMDTCPAAILGALSFPSEPAPEGPFIVLNIGNSHTMAALMDGNEVLGLFEHHTYQLRDRMQELPEILLGAFSGRLNSKEVLADGGGGVFLAKPIDAKDLRALWVIGPRRARLMEYAEAFPCPVSLPHPGGDMMMTGPLGLVAAFQQKYDK